MFESKYTARQKAAVLQAGCDRGVKPNRRIVELAAAGQLVYRDDDGLEVTLPAFEIPLTYCADLLRNERRKRNGTLVSAVAAMPAADGLAAMRRRLTSVADATIERLERAARSKAGADPVEITKAARMLRELAAVPEPGANTDAPPSPGKGPTADRSGGTTRHGPGADILADHRGSGDAQQTAPQSASPIPIPHTHIGTAAQTAPEAASDDGESTSVSVSATTSEDRHATTPTDTHGPGSAAGDEIAAHRAMAARGLSTLKAGVVG